MPKKLEVLGLTPDMEKYKMEGKKEKPEKVEFKPKSFEELKSEADPMLENARNKVFNFKQGIKDKFGSIWGKMKGVSKETLRTVIASPKIIRYGKNLAEYKAGQVKEAVVDKVENSMNAAGEFVFEKYRGTMDTAKAGYNKLEGKAVDAYIKFDDKVESIQNALREKIEKRRRDKVWSQHIENYSNLEESLEKYNGFLKVMEEQKILPPGRSQDFIMSLDGTPVSYYYKVIRFDKLTSTP